MDLVFEVAKCGLTVLLSHDISLFLSTLLIISSSFASTFLFFSPTPASFPVHDAADTLISNSNNA